MATHTSIKGLKIDTNNGPLILTQNINRMIVNPEATTPYKKQKTTFIYKVISIKVKHRHLSEYILAAIVKCSIHENRFQRNETLKCNVIIMNKMLYRGRTDGILFYYSVLKIKSCNGNITYRISYYK